MSESFEGENINNPIIEDITVDSGVDDVNVLPNGDAPGKPDETQNDLTTPEKHKRRKYDQGSHIDFYLNKRKGKRIEKESKLETKRMPIVDKKTLIEENKALVEEKKALIEQNKVLYDKVYIDKLTGLPSYEFFQEEVPEILKDVADPEKETGSVMFVFGDMDNLGQLNNDYDHVVADKVIANIGNIIKKAMRDTDWAVRRTGDEFMIVLGGLDEKDDEMIQKTFDIFRDRINKALEKPISVFDPKTNSDLKIKSSISMGYVVVKSGQTASLDSVEQLADDQMKIVKAANKKARGETPKTQEPTPEST